MLRILQTPEDTIPASVLYLRIYFLGVPFILVLNMESNMLRSVGDSFSPFLYMVVGCISNIVLDVVFVVFFHWGVAGVAIATVVAQVINMLLLTRRLVRTDEPYRLSLRELKLKGVYLSNMFRLGIPAGLQNTMYGLSNMIVQVGVNSLGTVVVASWAMTSKIDGVFWAVSNALGAAITSFVGQNLGARRMDRVQLCVRQGLILAFSITLTLSGLIMLAGKPLLHLLTKDPAVISTTWQMIFYFVPFYFTWTLIEVLSAVLRGSGDAVRPVVIIGLGICLFRILWISTVFRMIHTLPVLCLTYVASWTLTSILILLYFVRSDWRDRTRRILDK
jgi:putative MATE family efflux protein